MSNFHSERSSAFCPWWTKQCNFNGIQFCSNMCKCTTLSSSWMTMNFFCPTKYISVFGLLGMSAFDFKSTLQVCLLCHLHAMDWSNSPLVRHLLATWPTSIAAELFDPYAWWHLNHTQVCSTVHSLTFWATQGRNDNEFQIQENYLHNFNLYATRILGHFGVKPLIRCWGSNTWYGSFVSFFHLKLPRFHLYFLWLPFGNSFAYYIYFLLKTIENKTVLLCQRKRHTTRHVASAGTWDQSLGYPSRKKMGPVEVLWDGDGVPSERTWDQWKYYGVEMGYHPPGVDRQTPVKTEPSPSSGCER